VNTTTVVVLGYAAALLVIIAIAGTWLVHIELPGRRDDDHAAQRRHRLTEPAMDAAISEARYPLVDPVRGLAAASRALRASRYPAETRERIVAAVALETGDHDLDPAALRWLAGTWEQGGVLPAEVITGLARPAPVTTVTGVADWDRMPPAQLWDAVTTAARDDPAWAGFAADPLTGPLPGALTVTEEE